MGYRSYYTLTIEPDEDGAIMEQLREENEEARYAFDDTGTAQDETSWYESDEEMKAFSLKHPDVLFTMFREGEEWDDRSYTYYKNGKMQCCGMTCTFEEFDELKFQ